MKLAGYFFILTLICAVSVRVQGKVCSNDAFESGATICPGAGTNLRADVSYRFKTIRDLAWILTPRTYSITNGNQFTYRSIYEALSGSCAPNTTTIEGMKTTSECTVDEMKISINNGAKFIRMVCSPEPQNVQILWNIITSSIKLLPTPDWNSVEKALIQVANLNPQLPNLIPEIARFQCKPHPLCLHSSTDSKFCSAGTRTDYLKKWRHVVSWTDHISDTDGTGNAFMLSSCINLKGGWSVFSIPTQQGLDNMDAFQAVAKNQSFNEAYFTWQNFNEIPPVGDSRWF